MQELRDILVVVANGIGQMAIIAILFGSLLRRGSAGWPRDLMLGLLFATSGVLAMTTPAEVAPGVFVDLRCVIVGLGAAFVGWPAALIAGLATAAYRLQLGGASEAGCAAIAVTAILGLAWRRGMRGRRATASRNLLLLGVLISSQILVLAILPQTWSAAVLVPVLLTLTVSSLASAFAFGKMIERETLMIAKERSLSDVAYQDPLTSLLNRRGFEREIGSVRILDPDLPMSILLIDVDFFKRVNDTLGHAAGDGVLRGIAMILGRNVRSFDRVARHGGEEFAVLLPHTPRGAALEIAERLRRAVGQSSISGTSVTISIGVAACHDGRTSLEHMLEAADAALYRAKAAGRNRVECDQDAEAASGLAASAPMRLASASAR